jgi:CubicO group peptidase (beta-lactamase class C family)
MNFLEETKMNTRHLFALSATFLIVLLASGGPVAAEDPTPAEIDAIFADYDTTTSPGCSLGVVRDGELIYARGYGMANLEYGIALSPRSVFRTGSVGKQFTAMAIAILDQQGKLSLDDPLSKYFPEFPAWAGDITIRHLVHHTSGIRDYLTLAWLAGKGDEEFYTDEYALDLLAAQRNLNFPPGDEYLYSNSGYLLLAHTVKRVTGESLREWAAENIFAVLGMKNSHFHDDHTHIVPDRADGYAPTKEGYSISMTILDMVGDGGVYTTVEDFLLWDRNFYGNQLGGGGDELIRMVTTPGQLNRDDEMTYAFGLGVEEYRGLRTIEHGGSFVGFRADTIRFPEQRLSVVVYCNRADANPGQRSRKVAELFLADVMDPKEEPAAEPTEEVDTTVVSAERLQALGGLYWDEKRRSAWEVEWADAKLRLVLSGELRLEMMPLAADRFVIRSPWLEAEATFEKIADGTLQMSVLIEGSKEPRISERFDPRKPSSEELEAYAGTYFSDELGVSYALEVEEGSLVFRIVRHEPHELRPLFGEIFSSSDYGTFEFRRGADGVIDGFALDAGRVLNLEFRRQNADVCR